MPWWCALLMDLAAWMDGAGPALEPELEVIVNQLRLSMHTDGWRVARYV